MTFNFFGKMISGCQQNNLEFPNLPTLWILRTLSQEQPEQWNLRLHYGYGQIEFNICNNELSNHVTFSYLSLTPNLNDGFYPTLKNAVAQWVILAKQLLPNYNDTVSVDGSLTYYIRNILESLCRNSEQRVFVFDPRNPYEVTYTNHILEPQGYPITITRYQNSSQLTPLGEIAYGKDIGGCWADVWVNDQSANLGQCGKEPAENSELCEEHKMKMRSFSNNNDN